MLLAGLLYKFSLSEQIVEIGIIAIYCVASLLSGIFFSKGSKSRHFVWGMLAGMLYFGVILRSEVIVMAMNYNKLWKILIDRNMMKKDLIQMAGISTNAMAKMGKGGDVSTQVLRKICTALDCKIEDIVEVITDSTDVSSL